MKRASSESVTTPPSSAAAQNSDALLRGLHKEIIYALKSCSRKSLSAGKHPQNLSQNAKEYTYPDIDERHVLPHVVRPCVRDRGFGGQENGNYVSARTFLHKDRGQGRLRLTDPGCPQERGAPPASHVGERRGDAGSFSTLQKFQDKVQEQIRRRTRPYLSNEEGDVCTRPAQPVGDKQGTCTNCTRAPTSHNPPHLSPFHGSRNVYKSCSQPELQRNCEQYLMSGSLFPNREKCYAYPPLFCGYNSSNLADVDLAPTPGHRFGRDARKVMLEKKVLKAFGQNEMQQKQPNKGVAFGNPNQNPGVAADSSPEAVQQQPGGQPYRLTSEDLYYCEEGDIKDKCRNNYVLRNYSRVPSTCAEVAKRARNVYVQQMQVVLQDDPELEEQKQALQGKVTVMFKNPSPYPTYQLGLLPPHCLPPEKMLKRKVSATLMVDGIHDYRTYEPPPEPEDNKSPFGHRFGRDARKVMLEKKVLKAFGQK